MTTETFRRIPVEVKATGHFNQGGEDSPRGIFIFEDESDCAEVTREQHWNVRFTGCLEGTNAIDRKTMIKVLENSMDAEVKLETRRIELTEQKWCAANAPNSVTAFRFWTLFKRTQGLTGPATVTHSLVDPWALVLHGHVQMSHNERGIPSDTTRANVVNDGVRMRAPPILGETVKRAVKAAAYNISVMIGEREIHGSASIHVFPRNALKMTRTHGPTKNVFGETDESMRTIRIIALPPSVYSHPRSVMRLLTSGHHLDPVVAETEIIDVRTRGITVPIAITKVLVNGMDEIQDLQYLVNDMDPTAVARLWRRNETFIPVERKDYWQNHGKIELAPRASNANVSNSAMIEKLELLIQGKMNQAAERGLEKADYEQVAKATTTLVTARVKENVAEIVGKIKEAGMEMDSPHSPTTEEGAWHTESSDKASDKPSNKKLKAEEPIDIWNNPIDIWVFGEERGTTVTFALIDTWRKEKAAGANVTTVQHMVHYMTYAGKLSPNLGFGNESLRDQDDFFHTEVYMNVRGKHMRRNELLRNPSYDYWPQIAAPGACPAIGFVRIPERKDILSFMATWDEEEAQDKELDADADNAWKETQEENEKLDGQSEGEKHLDGTFTDAREHPDTQTEGDFLMETDNKSSGSKRKTTDTELEPAQGESDSVIQDYDRN